MKPISHRILIVIAILALVPLACNLSAMQEGAVDAAVAETLTAAASQTRAPEIATTEAPAPPSDTPVPPTDTEAPTATETFTPTATVTQTPQPCDAAAFVKDVTYPDGEKVYTNGNFTKTWRLKNVGTCTWTSGYRLIFDSGDRMGAPNAVQVTGGTVPPGASVDVSVDLKAPADEGTYQGYFKLRNPSGVVFGIGPAASGAFWVKVKAEKLLLLMPTMMIIVTLIPGP
jgi:hypothetical protein